MVTRPSRGLYLLDLVLTDMDELLSSDVLSSIADHCFIRSFMDLQVPSYETRTRQVFDYQSANWYQINATFLSMNWSWVDHLSIDAVTQELTATILATLRAHVPIKIIEERFGRHPWLNQRCIDLVAAKHAAFGISVFDNASALCSQGLKAEYEKFVKNTRKRLERLKRGSKQWWKLSRNLMDKRSRVLSIPALQDKFKRWILHDEAKADLFADTFCFEVWITATDQKRILLF